MNRQKTSGKKPIVFVLIFLFLLCAVGYIVLNEDLRLTAKSMLLGEPQIVRELRNEEVAQKEEGYLEYYFQQLDDVEKRIYREMLQGIRQRKEEFYLSSKLEGKIDRVYHAVLKDHPELYWVHNRKQVYTTTFSKGDYCTFSPGYSYTEEEILQIEQAIENVIQEIYGITEGITEDYEKVKVIYTYLIDHIVYEENEHDQNIAGVFWNGSAVCAGYARAMQFLMDKLGVFCIYVEGDSTESPDGHAWNIVKLDDEYYYVDVTNGDQPEFLEGDAVQLAEHKTIIYDYLCPFPEEYEKTYIASSEFPMPQCASVDKNFYVLNQGCFDRYDWNEIYDYCVMRLNNDAAVIRFKFSDQEAFEQAFREWVEGDSAKQTAQYYMQKYNLSTVEYHCGVLDNLKTVYLIF